MISRIRALIQDQSLRGASLRSGFWTVFGFGTQSVLRLGSNLILTRLLAPEMFGLMALAQTFLTGVQLMSDIGTKQSVIRSARGEDDGFLATAWTIQAGRGALIGAIACALAWPAALFYDQDSLFAVLCVLALVPLIEGFKSISEARASRNMELGRQTLIQLASYVVTVVVMVAMAWVLQSVWALVIGTVIGSALRTVLSHLYLSKFHHRFHLEPGALKEIISFGRWVLLGTFFTFLGGRGITAVHGALVPLDVLGILAVSTVLIRALESLVMRLLSAVGLPAFSKALRENPKSLPRLLSKLRNRVLTVAVAIFVLISFFAQGIIDALYDQRYTLAGAFLSIQALNGALRILTRPYQDVMLAVGDSKLHAGVMFWSAAVGIAGTIAGFYLFGYFGMIAGMGVAALLVFAISTRFAHRRGYANLPLDFSMLALLLALYVYMLSQLMVTAA